MSTDNSENQSSNNILQAYAKAFQNYVNFKNRTSRYDYWGFILVNWLIIVFLVLTDIFLLKTSSPAASIWENFMKAYSYVLIIPQISAIVRRFHDTDKSAIKWILLPILSAILLMFIFAITVEKRTMISLTSMLILMLSIACFVCLCRRGSEQDNEYGSAIVESKSQRIKGLIIPIVLCIIPIIFVLIIGVVAGYSNAKIQHKANQTADSVYGLLVSAKGLNGMPPIVEENQAGRTEEILQKGMVSLGGEMHIKLKNGLYAVTLTEVTSEGCEALFSYNWQENSDFLQLQTQNNVDCRSCTMQVPCTLEWMYK
ncbi:MAG: DUF805 domain-containing protein [Alphaproteobacteria bacterium]|nr:DUF805 domain-containing protein [Alphaproteobacteria bacterium]